MPYETVSLYGGKITIEFNPALHSYRRAGEKQAIISVTAATGCLDKSRPLMIWAERLAREHYQEFFRNSKETRYSQEQIEAMIEEAITKHKVKLVAAADSGTKVHDWAEQFMRSKVQGASAPSGFDGYSEGELNGINAFIDWYNSNEVEPVEIEKTIYSVKHNYVGRTDLIAKVNNRLLVCDYKTGKGIYGEAYYQNAAYWNAYEEETKAKIEGGLLLHFDKETGAFATKEITPHVHGKNLPVFISLLTVKKREKEVSKY